MTELDLDAIEARWQRSGAADAYDDSTRCRCADAPHENALHDLAHEDVPALVAEVRRLRELATTCICPTSPATCDGPQPDCPVHGAIRAYNEAAAKLQDIYNYGIALIGDQFADAIGSDLVRIVAGDPAGPDEGRQA